MREHQQHSRRRHDRSRGKARKLTVTGTVVVRMGHDGHPDSVKVAGEDGQVYPVLLEERGLELARSMAGRRAVVVARVMDDDGDCVLEVRRFRRARRAAEEPAETWDETWADGAALRADREPRR